MYKSISVLADWAYNETRQTTGVFKKKEIVRKNVDRTLVDLDELTNRIDAACNTLASDGYEVVSILPINKGCYQYEGAGSNYGGGYGYGYAPTVGAIVTARRVRTA